MRNYIEGLVSVVIPTYKRSDTLIRAINSVKNQSYKNIEILVVDDNEPGDEYSNLAESLVRSLSYHNLFLVRQKEHINGAAARNAGIKTAKGEYVAFLDDDDLWVPDKIEKQVSYMQNAGENIAGVSCRKIYFSHGRLTHISEDWKIKSSQNFDILSKKLNVSTCTLLIRHDVLDKIGGFDEKLRRHQEVQLLAFITSRYQIDYYPEIMTIIDCGDVSNRPSAEKLLIYKSDFFESVMPVLEHYSNYNKIVIKAHNMTEVAWAYYRDGKKYKGIMMLLRCFIFPSVLMTFLKRMIGKRNSRNRLYMLSESEREKFFNLIMEK